MVGVLRSVLMGLHRFAPPSDKAELDASAAVPKSGIYGPTSGPRHSVRFRAPVLRRILHIIFGITTQNRKEKTGAPVSSMLALSRPKRP
jgi:hypothetical protein